LAGFGALLSTLVGGVLLGGVYALVALGLAVAWGASRVINLAHGALVVFGSYLAFSLYKALGMHPVVALPVVALAGFALGYLLYYLVLYRVAENELVSLLATFGLSLFLYAVMLAIWGPDPRTLLWAEGSARLGPVFIPLSKLYASIAALALIGFYHLILYRTSVGRAMRAMAQSFEVARVVGIEPRSVGSIAFGLGAAAAFAAGVVVTGYASFTPDAGGTWLIIALAVVAMAGLRNLLAVLAGGVVLGAVSQLAGFTLGAMYQEIVPMVALALFFVISPEGLFTRVRVRRV